ncbi:MAG: 3-deoxy-D-manno-octulosonic acid transferase [Proteobacteria bacterium]|nr:3-deoxy-D-manno-octulosonic acid transferase [Pseudomonadota bacterium]MBU4464116.1 3-deoxy-D-manno-octulosonic acid transferase [Pseudomonadota bacterium]
MIFLYNILLAAGITIGLPLIIPLVLTTDKRRKTVLHRLGLMPLPNAISQNRSRKPDNRPIWIHALSVGEVLSAVPLVKELKSCFKHHDIVFSTSTKTGFEIANNLLKENVDAIFFFPYDLPISVKHIAAKVEPDIVIIVESDIWPNFLFEMKRRNVPVILVNARLSRRSYFGYKLFLFFSKRLFLFFSKICVQSSEDARRFSLLGIPPGRITITGNIKFDQQYDFAGQEELNKLRQSLLIKPSQKILLAGSTHYGEEAILLDAFSRLKKKYPDLILIIVPRNPDRTGSVCRICKSEGLFAVTMTELEEKKTRQDVIVVDRIGLLKMLYAIVDIAFVGGSLVRCGGHNPLEPAAFSRPIIFGPDMSDFADISDMLISSGGAVSVQDAESIYNIVSELLTDNQKAGEMGSMAFKTFNANKGAVEKTLNTIENIM